MKPTHMFLNLVVSRLVTLIVQYVRGFDQFFFLLISHFCVRAIYPTHRIVLHILAFCVKGEQNRRSTLTLFSLFSYVPIFPSKYSYIRKGTNRKMGTDLSANSICTYSFRKNCLCGQVNPCYKIRKINFILHNVSHMILVYIFNS